VRRLCNDGTELCLYRVWQPLKELKRIAGGVGHGVPLSRPRGMIYRLLRLRRRATSNTSTTPAASHRTA
jgi:hypothetical protein